MKPSVADAIDRRWLRGRVNRVEPRAVVPIVIDKGTKDEKMIFVKMKCKSCEDRNVVKTPAGYRCDSCRSVWKTEDYNYYGSKRERIVVWK